MRVKVNELKTHLSRYLKSLDKEGPIEVCVREEPVAYLVSARNRQAADRQSLQAQVESAGLSLCLESQASLGVGLSEPVPAGDGRTDVDSVQQMREGRDW